MAEQEISPVEIRDFIQAFMSDRMKALYFVPNNVFGFLRGRGYLDAELDVTPEGRKLITG